MSRKSHKRLSSLLAGGDFPGAEDAVSKQALSALELKMLRIQQGIWHSQSRAIIVFEGADAAGKGGAIRRLTRVLDPRGVRVHATGAPDPTDQARHYLYRFWMDLPKPGSIAIFDRSWYGRVLAEKVKKLTPKNRLAEAYSEINDFEKMLTNDGIDLVKIFLAIHPDEQLRRFEERLKNPYKQWKLTGEDLEAHAEWDKYVDAADEMLQHTSVSSAKWHLIPADNKDFTRGKVLKTVTKALSSHGDWMESAARKLQIREESALLKKFKAAQGRKS